MRIGHREVGNLEPPLVIAEIGINHEGSIETAIAMAKAAINSGAEVIKHQTHIPDSEMSEEAKYIIPGNTNVSIYEVIKRCALRLSDEEKLAKFVRSQGRIYMSTPFSFEAVDFLESLDVPAYKIGSGECNNYPLVEYVASKKKPVIMSTGMNSISTIRPSVDIFRKFGNEFALLHCTNLYPTPNNLIRLNALTELAEAFPDAVLGLSDHSLTNYPCIAAVALGASILERHFTDSKNRPGPDITCSMDSLELKELILASRTVHEASQGSKFPVAEEEVTIAFAFASVVATRDLNPGEIIDRSTITLKRPHGGELGPTDFANLIGRKVLSPIKQNTQIKRNQIEP